MTTYEQVRCAWIATLIASTSVGCGTSPSGGSGAIAANAGAGGGGIGVVTGDGGGLPPGDPSGPGGPSGGGTGAGQSLPCDVDAVLGAHCRSCHGAVTAYGAPESLVTYGDLTAPAKEDPSKPVYALVQARVHASSNPMPPPPASPLSPGDLATLDAWVAAGAPAAPPGTGACGADVDAGDGLTPSPLPCTPDTLIRPPAPYAVSSTLTDQYVCYGFDVTPSQKRHVIALGPHIDNKTVLHHLLLFQSSSAYSATPTPCQAFGSTAWTLIGGWAPGGEPYVLPAEAGFPEEGTTHYIMQVHYNNAKALAGQEDSSGFDLCTTDQLRKNDADVLAVGSVNFSIPPRTTLDLSCTYTNGDGPIHVFEVTPHMHLLGESMVATDVTTSTPIVDKPFSFQAQLGYPVAIDIANGDTINTHCVWANTTDQTVSFGENTGNEMCFGFLAYYPKITAPLWSWTTPSILASCTSTTK